MEPSFKPLEVDQEALANWRESSSVLLPLLRLWSRHARRGSAALPTFLGRHLLVNRKYVLRSPTDALYAVEPSDLGSYLAVACGGARYPAHVLETCIRHLARPGVFYDIGANLGYVTIEVARAYREGVDIIAFEPQSGLAEKLVISAHLNGVGEVKVFSCLIGDDHGSRRQLFLPLNSAHASMISRGSRASVATRDMASIDGLVASGAMPPPTLMKIDVEGAELMALRGARQVCAKHRPFIVFESDDNMRRFDYAKTDVFEIIRSFADYRFYDIVPDNRGGLRGLLPLTSPEKSQQDDILAVPPGGTVRGEL